MRGDALLVRVSAPPLDGAANAELVAVVARAFGRPRRNVAILSGHTSRDKRVAIEDLSPAEFSAQLSVILGRDPE